MAYIITLNGKRPKIGKNVYLAETATLIGDVVIGDNSSIWFGAVLRGDVNSIVVGNMVNIQDNAVIHTSYGTSVSILEDKVSIGHNAIVHGAQVGPGTLIGMGATLLDNAKIGAGCVIAANSLVLAKTVIEDGMLYAGVPAKPIRQLTPEQIQKMAIGNAEGYGLYASWFLDESATLERVDIHGNPLD
ncbi:MAG: gamma carbonic anhydrase family protein [Bacteroidetes bacterium]|nr:MAG: gamma carbonic anhydrase family protein [Bacteroidota bacterium]